MLDYGLIGQASKPSGYDPLQSIARGQVIAAQQQKQQAAQAEAQRQQMIAQVVQQFPEDPDAAVRFLKSRDWEAAAFLEKQLTEHRTKLAEQRGKELDNEVKQGTINKARADAERAALQSKALDDWARFYDSDPEEAEHAARIVLGPDKWMTFKGQMEQRAETARHNAATEASTLSGQQVTMRGQDMTAATAAANRATTERGQNMTAQTAANRLALDKAQGTGAGGGKLSASAIEKIAGVDQSLGMLSDLETALPKMGGAIGPLDSWITSGKLATGMGVTPELAEFAAQVTGLQNAVIKAITGAQMSEPEAKRIMSQIPDMKNPMPVFKARMATTKRNLELLKKRTIELSGGVSDAPAAPTAAPKLSAEDLIRKYSQ